MPNKCEVLSLDGSIPDEIWIEIFVHLTNSLETILVTLPSVCKRFYQLINPPLIPSSTADETFDHQVLNDECINNNCNDGDDLMNDRLYENLLLYNSLNRLDRLEILKQYKSFRIAFKQMVLFGLPLPIERCFRNELCYKGIRVLENESAYSEKKIQISEGIVECCGMGRTVLMKEDFQSSNAGMCIVNNPMLYNTGTYFFEFLVHKSGTFDNCLMGILLTDVLKECQVENPQSLNSLSERFETKTSSLDVPFLGYLGSQQSVGFGYYGEVNHVYHKNTVILSYEFNAKQETLTYPCETSNYEYIVGVYFDSNNLHLAFSRNGVFATRQLDISDIIHNKSAEYLSGNLAFYPALSMGQLDDAITIESRVSLKRIQSLKKISQELKFEPYNTD